MSDEANNIQKDDEVTIEVPESEEKLEDKLTFWEKVKGWFR